MKPLLLLTIVISFCVNCRAQLWKPYVTNATCIYGYPQNAGQTKLLSIRYDSIYVNGETEVAFAYTRSYDDDSCMNIAHKNYRFDPFENYPHEYLYPFPIEIIYNNDTIISSVYTFNNENEKDAVMTVLGVSDSVKIYSSPSINRIIISKRFGLVELDGYVLMGFKTDSISLGLSIPSIETTLRLAPRDILYYRTMKDTSTTIVSDIPRLYADTRDSIVSVSTSGNKLNIGLIRQYQNYFDPALSYHHTIESEYNLKETNRLFQDGAPIQRYYGSMFYVKPKMIMFTSGNDTIFKLSLYEEGRFGNCRFASMYDICSSVSLTSNMLIDGYSSCNAIFGGGSETKLIGSRIGNIVSGHINLGLESTRPDMHDITVFPNPTADLLNLNTTTELGFTIIDVLGNKQMEGKTSQTISLHSLPPGVYMLILNSEAAHKTFRILKK